MQVVMAPKAAKGKKAAPKKTTPKKMAKKSTPTSDGDSISAIFDSAALSVLGPLSSILSLGN